MQLSFELRRTRHGGLPPVCQRSPLPNPRAMPQCVEQGKAGCTSPATCCNTKNFCAKEAVDADAGKCSTVRRRARQGVGWSAHLMRTVSLAPPSHAWPPTAAQPGPSFLRPQCVDDRMFGCDTSADCCTPGQLCNNGLCSCALKGQPCTGDTSCCSDGPKKLYCQKDNYLSPSGTCQEVSTACVGGSGIAWLPNRAPA